MNIMKRLHRLRKIFSLISSLALVFNTLLPASILPFTAPVPAYAATESAISASQPNLAFDSSKHAFTLSVNADRVEYVLVYEQNGKVESVQGTGQADDGLFTRELYAGTCSSHGTCVAHSVSQGLVKVRAGTQLYSIIFRMEQGTMTVLAAGTPAQFDVSEEEMDWLTNPIAKHFQRISLDQAPGTPTQEGQILDGASTEAASLIWHDNPDGSVITTQPVVEGIEYRYKDSQASVVFTTVTLPGYLTIKEIQLTEEQMQELGAVSGTAYDISSDMPDGSFVYTLTLPEPDTSKAVQVQYSEDGQNFQDLASESQNDTLIIQDLNHFTLFVVVDPTASVTGGSGEAWLDKNFIYASDNSRAKVDLTAGGMTSKTLKASDFNLAIPENAVISGVEVFIEKSVRETRDYASRDNTVKLMVNGIVVGDNKANSDDYFNNTTDAVSSYGGDGDMWGITLTPAQVNAADFGVAYKVKRHPSGVNPQRVRVDQIQVGIYYNTPPGVPTLVSPADGASVKPAAAILDWAEVVDADGDIITYNYRSSWSGGGYGPVSTGTNHFINASGSIERTYSWQVQACDEDICSAWSGPWTVTIDNTAPTATIDYSTTALTNGDVIATLNPSEPVTVTNNGGSATYTFSANGSFIFEFSDDAGNTGSATATVGNIDKTAPDVEITAPTASNITGTIQIRGTVTDEHPHHYWLVIQNSSNTTIAGPRTVNRADSFTDQPLYTWNTSSVPDGTYKIRLEARDAADNKDAGSIATKTVIVDHTSPTVDLVFPIPGSAATSFQAVFSEDVNAADAQNPANYFLHNWPGAGGSGNLVGHAAITYDNSTHTATVTFTTVGWYISPEQEWGVQDIHDLAGNVQSVNPYAEYSTAMEPPTTPVASPAAGDYPSDQSVTLTSSDSGSGLAAIYYTMDGLTPDDTKTRYTGPITVDRDMTIKAIAYDRAGNESDIATATYGIPPIISAEASSFVSDTSMTVTWTTDDPATSRVVYDTVSHSVLGAAPNYDYAFSTVETDTDPKVISHSVTIDGLTAGTTYYFRVVSHGSPEAVGDEFSATTTGGTTLSATTTGGGDPGPGDGLSDGKSDGKTESLFGPPLASVLGVTTYVYGQTQEDVLGTQVEEEASESAITPTPSPQAGQVLAQQTATTSWWLWILIISIILLTAILWRKRRKKAS